MSTGPTRPATREGLLLWVMHRFAQAFGEHAIIKGGMALRLLDSPRSTNDIDYVFVPYESKKDIVPKICEILRDLEDADIKINLHSTMLRADIRLDSAAVQVEASVDISCDATPIATGGFAREQDQPSQIVRIMRLDTALAQKLAAWNERRLARDLYDCYFLARRLGEKPNLTVLKKRLSEIRSQLPKLRRKRKMSIPEFAEELRQEAENLTQKRLADELGGLLPHEEMAGLAPRIKAALNTVAEQIEKAV
jgi:predicted nucleotidyltransferase component of viral defense system